ncbi:MAG: D-alanyl-D-alanine carboxypeptidase family protein [Methylomonas sp.]|nr:D-alanyl-D-alanine carboxypeptidase family protein [Methylomonas sp.]
MAKIILTGSVGRGGVNAERDVKAVQAKLNEIEAICREVTPVCDDEMVDSIMRFQRTFLVKPDGLINVQGMTITLLNNWSIKSVSAGVDLRGNLQKAWDLVNPLLPAGSYCSSGYRSAEDQRRILHKFFSNTYKAQIVAKYGAKEWQDAWDNKTTKEARILEMVRGVGQAIATPGKSMHQQGKAVDIGGPDDDQQVKIVKMVAKANPALLSGVVIKERNGCVHFEIR